MGACYDEMSVQSTDKAKVKSQFEAHQEMDRYENGHSYSGGLGMATGLKFDNKVFTNEFEASEYLQEKCEKWDDAIAVLIRDKNNNEWYYIGAWCSS